MMEEDFICPITVEIMVDPVLIADGHSYERRAIENWLSQSQTSPISGEALSSRAVIPNHALKRAIQSFQVRSAIATAEATLIPNDFKMKVTALTDESNFIKYLDLEVSIGEGKPKPLCLICVLDVSGSMDLPSQNESCNADGVSFSRLDLVKHAMHTTIELMSSTDFLQVISFSNEAKQVLKYVQMTPQGKVLAHACINELNAGGATNLWQGLSLSIDQASTPPLSGMNVAIMLQTDGEPTPSFSPPRGIVSALKLKLGKLVSPQFSIHTCGYGFGNALDTPLLQNIAELGNQGTFAYIPDGSMVGTVFIHLLTNLSTTVWNSCQIEIAGAQINVGSLRLGQVKHFLVPYYEAGGSFANFSLTMNQTKFADKCIVSSPQKQRTSFEYVRNEFVSLLHQTIELGETNQSAKALQELKRFASKYNANSDFRIKSLVRDVSFSFQSDCGQVEKACQNWAKWGRHYLPCVLSAHVHQEKINFKDASMDIYTTPLLEKAISLAEDVFASLPAPVSAKRAIYSPSAVNMRTMINPHGGCFSGNSLIQTLDGHFVRMDEVKKGMSLRGGGTVVCVVVYEMTTNMCQVSSQLSLTPYHPVKVGKEWQFPLDLDHDSGTATAVYNLVLDKVHIVYSGNIQCVTLGHGFRDNNVVEHAYFGTQKVIQDLEKKAGFAKGFVSYQKGVQFIVDPLTQLVESIVDTPEQM